MDAGVGFVTAPSLNPAIMEFAAKQNVAVLPGALAPTEVAIAWSAGADFVKVFPCGPVGGDRYIKTLHASLPQIPLIAAGGVNQQTAASFILSGGTAIGVGTELIPTEAIQRRQSQRIHECFSPNPYLKTPRKQPIFGDELVTSFCRSTSPTRILCKNGFGTWRGHAPNAGCGLTGYRESKRNGFQPNRLLFFSAHTGKC